jgi:DNA-binding response OmpR family regulator
MGEYGKRILVIDDDPAMARMIAVTLRVEGYAVAVAHDGSAALEALDESPADAIILDLMMPVMDGRTFYRELRARPDDTPVLVLSAHGAHSAAREMGAEDYLAKPFQPPELAEKIRRLVDDATGEPET